MPNKKPSRESESSKNEISRKIFKDPLGTIIGLAVLCLTLWTVYHQINTEREHQKYILSLATEDLAGDLMLSKATETFLPMRNGPAISAEETHGYSNVRFVWEHALEASRYFPKALPAFTQFKLQALVLNKLLDRLEELGGLGNSKEYNRALVAYKGSLDTFKGMRDRLQTIIKNKDFEAEAIADGITITVKMKRPTQ